MNRLRTALLTPRSLILSLALFLPNLSASSQSQTVLPEAPAAQPAQPRTFVGRLAKFYREDWTGTAPQSPAPPRRGLPSPLDSPPFPNSDWSYGGSPVIGEPDTNSYPLMTALNGARSRTKLYGWVEPTVNVSNSLRRNAPVANDLFSNTFQLNQAVIYIERLPDSVQQDHVDIGYHLTAFYGTDYRYTTNKGYFSTQLIAHSYQYGFDPILEYIDVYVPKVAQGLNIRLGRYISIPGIEAQLTPNNYFFSHSLLYSIDPFTDTGILATVKLNDKWLIQAGITGSHDVALWTRDSQPSGTACVSYTTSTVNDNVYLCANGINDGKYAYNNLQQYDATWYHKFSKTWHTATEVYLMYERDTPSVNGTLKPQPNANGAICRPGLQSCLAPEYAFVNYINKQLGPHDFISFRSDLLNDKKGQRTGLNTKYTENTVALSHWVGTTVQIRPEIRFDHSWDRKGYNEGANSSQFTAATDLIFHF